MRNKVSNATDAQVISAFQDGVADVRMLEKLGIHDNITSVVKLFDLADKCAKAEEGRLFVKNEPEDPAEKSKKKKSSTEKRKTTAVLAAEPDAKQLASSGLRRPRQGSAPRQG